MRSAFIEKAEQYIKPSATIGFIPAYGGAEFFCKKMIKKGVTVFGLQKPPYICRTKERGKIADLMSKKKELLLATLPNEKAKETAMLLQDMLGIKTEVMPNYMNVTLLPGNPLLHTSGSYCYLKDYKKGDTYPQQIYYYQSWNDECSRIICAFSDEMMNICDRIPIDLIYPAELQEEEQYRRYFKEALELEILEQGYPADKAVLYEILELLVETVTSRKKFLRICGEEKPKEVVKSRLMKLDSSHIQYILECLKENSTQIRNIKQYLLATLYNAPVTVDSYYSAQVRHEFGWGGRVDKN